MSVGQEPSGLSVDFGVELLAGIGSYRDEVRKWRRDMQQRARRADVPRDRREIFYSGSANGNTFPASGNLFLVIDGPQYGMLWDVRQIVVGGPAATSTPPGTAYVFAQTAQPADMNLVSCRDFSLTPFPAKGFYGTGEFKMRPPMSLWVVIVGGTPGLAYSAYADIQEYPDTPLMATVAET